MPTINNPTHYERCSGIAPGREDWLFNLITPDDSISDTGRTEAPTGHVSLVELDPWLINRLRDDYAEGITAQSLRDLTTYGMPDPGWYIIRRDDNGLIWGIWYGRLDSTFNEERARADYAEAEATYAAWDDCDCGCVEGNYPCEYGSMGEGCGD